MELVVITGMSGSGKTHALHILEDLGFYCVDNLPVNMLGALKDKLKHHNVAVVCDIRTGDIKTLSGTVKTVGGRVIFLDADDNTIIRRYKETRRNHPLGKGEGLANAISNEREFLKEVKETSAGVIDTSNLSLGKLRVRLMDVLGISEDKSEFEISVESFGFKNGTPQDADMVFDVRCFPNPFYVEELRDKTGNDKEVQDFVMASADAKKYLEKIIDMTNFIIPIFKNEGRYSLVIAIGCTGGRHRSVTFVNLLDKALKDSGNKVTVKHRDIHK